MRKFQEFFNEIAEVRANLRGLGTVLAKEVIGDSTSNNRTLTVMQTARLLSKTGDLGLAIRLLSAVEVLEPVILNKRNKRTDAVDIGEFVKTYREVVMNDGKLRTELGVALRGV